MQLREEEMLKLTAEAELKALRAQVNPHFLFNALTTIGYLIETAPPRALNTLMQLTALLRGVLKSEGEFTTLGRELELVEHYLKIEHERFEERLRVRIDVPQALRAIRIPTLVLQPLVENAIKHGVAPSRTGGDVEVSAAIANGSTPADRGPQQRRAPARGGAACIRRASRRRQRPPAAGRPLRRHAPRSRSSTDAAGSTVAEIVDAAPPPGRWRPRLVEDVAETGSDAQAVANRLG